MGEPGDLAMEPLNAVSEGMEQKSTVSPASITLQAFKWSVEQATAASSPRMLTPFRRSAQNRINTRDGSALGCSYLQAWPPKHDCDRS